MAIKIRGPENRDVKTGADGKYSAAGLPPGVYTVSASAPAGLVTQNARTVTLAGKSCEEIVWFISQDTHISGRLSLADGAPAAGMYMDLLHPDPNYPGGVVSVSSSTTDSEGRYEFARINSGDYYIVANNLGPAPDRPFPHVFYRGSEKLDRATVVHLAPRQSLSSLDFGLPVTLKAVAVKAIVLQADGVPAARATIMAHDTDHLSSGEPPSAVTGSQGEATLKLFAGREYYITVLGSGGCAIPFKFTAKEGLVLSPVNIKQGLNDCFPPRR